MLSTSERKKIRFTKALMPSFGSDTKKYDEIYQQFCREGYTKDLCENYADAFVDNVKKPAADDVIQLASLYRKLNDYKNSEFYLETLANKKLASDDRFHYCLGMLKTMSVLGNWRDAEDFRTDNINFIQTYAAKQKGNAADVRMNITLALVDCAGKHYSEAFKLLNFGYKPKGKNDLNLLRIFTAAVYIYSKAGDEEALAGAVETAKGCLRLFDEFPFEWSKAHYEKKIENAANGII